MTVRAWAPAVPGIVEVLHAHFTDHAYPEHTHDEWTLLLVDAGAVRYDLDRRERGAVSGSVTLLPPHVAHTGRSATNAGFRKRVLYLDAAVLDPALTGAAVAAPSPADPLLRRRVAQLHASLDEALHAESRLALVADRLRERLRGAPPPPAPDRLAADLRDLLDAHLADGLTLHAAAAVLHAHPSQLVRRFTAAFGLPPHRYLTGKRVSVARARLLAGQPIAEVATAVGFHDQAHLHRHFRALIGTTPGRYAADGPGLRRG